VVEFAQHTFTGKRVLVVDGAEVFRCNVKYKLTGVVEFVLAGTAASVNIEALDFGQMEYTLLVGGKVIAARAEESVLSTWEVSTPEVGTCLVQFDHLRFFVHVDRVCVEAESDFTDDGSKYVFTLPNGSPAEILVTRLSDARGKTHKVNARLFVRGEEVKTGADDEAATK
jgi:hypothetical protein